MFTRNPLRLAIAFLLTAGLLSVAGWKLEAQNHSQQEERFVVHEWGTFTSVSTADGKPQLWNPLSGPSELPSFVYRSSDANQCFKSGSLALVRMETPVLYFYSDRDVSASVRVDFPKGCITEWYPQARAERQTIDWGGFVAQPGAKENFPIDQSRSHYYPARETDAAPIHLGADRKSQQEKFLFYRGIGFFDLPLSVRLQGDQVVVRNAGQGEIAQVILFEHREGRSGWRIHGALKGEAVIERPSLDQKEAAAAPESLYCEIENALVTAGLYKKEAAAMVKTWRDSWFEEGLRIFYLVPRSATDSILPITIKPAPTELTRVFVGRAELITPEMERDILAAVKQFDGDSDEARAAAVNVVRRYGRFADPVLRQAMSNSRSEASRSRISTLIMAASAKRAAHP